MTATAAIAPPRVVPRWSLAGLCAAACLSVGAWTFVERISTAGLHPRYFEMLAAARVVQAASRTIKAEKISRHLLQPADIDSNQTGLIGSPMTAITTTIGDLGSKRTVTNPDFAAALVRMIDSLNLPSGSPVVVIVSGSFLGADIATLAAVEALSLRPVLVASMSASMFGANDPELNILDILGLLHQKGIIQTRARLAVLGGELGVAEGMDAETVAALRASAARYAVDLVDQPPFPSLVDRLLDKVKQTLGQGVAPALVINVGGALVALGSCPQSFEFPPGLSRHSASCSEGVPGLALRFAAQGDIPVLHIINIRRLALEMGLPFDPDPLPEPGANPAVYGTASAATTIREGGPL